jgi:uncharacterized protein (DUF2267 family)
MAPRGCLQVLRDRFTVHETVHLGAQLPAVIRGLYDESWKPSQVPVKLKDKEAFLIAVQRFFETGQELTDPETVVRAVFKLLLHRCPKERLKTFAPSPPPKSESRFRRECNTERKARR